MVGTAFLGLTGTAITADAATTTTASSSRTDYGLADTSQHGVILHCWNWSYNNIKKYMKDIAAAGYTSIQTSPVTQPKDYYWEGVAYGNVGIPDGLGGYEGNWWKVYQPVTMSICDNGNTWFGTKEEFKAMCDEAEKYGVRVIVDIVANHMGNIQGWKIGDVETVMSDISKQVGEFWNPDMLTDPTYWHISTSWVHSSDGRFDVTQGNMGMPDLNTGDSRVQQMVLNLLKECIDCGADGFRFDAAKHIETPADDPAFASDFWDVVLDGARNYYKQVNGYDGVYFYGEVLNRIDDSNAEAYYRSKMSITDNSTSDNLRNSVINGGISGLASSGYCGYIGGQGNKAVLWAESHDTYMGGGSSYDANDTDIKRTWAIVASRKDSTGLFFARPYYSKDILAGDVSKARQSTDQILSKIDQTQLGDVGTLTWADPSVVAVNRFRNFFVGQSESLGSSGNSIAYNVRGNSGIVIVKGDGAGSVSLEVNMANGTYTDQVTGEKFTVSNGTLTGKVTGADGVAVVYNPTTDYGTVTPEEPTVIKISATTADGSTSFTTDSIDVTLKTENAVSSTYTTTEGESGSFTGTKTITVGSKTEPGNDVSVTITATSADGTEKTKTYTYTKKGARTGYPKLDAPGVVFDNESYNWAKVYAYVYDSSKNNNAAWPGVAMTEVDGNYYTYEIPSNLSGQLYVIFNNGSGVQYPTGEGLAMLSTEKKLFVDNKLIDLPESSSLSVRLSASKSTIDVGDTVTLTATATDNDGSVEYQFSSSDGTVIKSYSSASSCIWTPTEAGTYTITVKAKDSSSTASATTKITVNKKETPVTPLENNSTISSTSINKGDTITINAVAAGGTAPYKYAITAKHSTASAWTSLKGYNTTATHTWKPGLTGTYQVCVKVRDTNNEEVKKFFTVKVNAVTTPLTNNSTVSKTTINKGESITLKAVAAGGTAPYKYAMSARHSTASAWTSLKGYNTTATHTWTPGKTGTYQVCVKVKDAKGTEVKKFFTVTVNSTTALANNSTISSTSITKGDSVTLKAVAAGGTTPYKYAMSAKHSTATEWTSLKGYSTTATHTWTPGKTGTYQVCIKMKDAKNTEVKKFFTLKVNSTALTNTSTISATSVSAGTKITINGSATNVYDSAWYQFSYKSSSASSYTVIKDFSDSKTATWTPTTAGTYTVRVVVQDMSAAMATKTFTVTVK